jgi:2-octaprenyl-6-methoxyphenol hydroxylase
MTRADIVVVGGGLAGLSTGLALARSGWQVVVLESRRVPARDAWGFILWPPGTRTLDWLGVLPEVLTKGSVLTALRWYAGDGREWMSVDLSRIEGGLFVGILPSRLENILKNEVQRQGIVMLDGVDRWQLEKDGSMWTIHVETDQGPETVLAPLVIGADGPNSRLREVLGLSSSRWQPQGQVIYTGVGGPLSFRESRQAMGVQWSGGCAAIGDRSWLYAMTNVHLQDALEPVRAYAALDPSCSPAFAELEHAIELRPWSMRVPRWATEGAVVVGDAAHGMLPHLGLGGTLTLEDVPVLGEVIGDALRSGDMSVGRLSAFQRRRSRRVSYARRISNIWAAAMTSPLPWLRFARDLNFSRLSRRSPLMYAFVRELSSQAAPTIRTRMGMWLP